MSDNKRTFEAGGGNVNDENVNNVNNKFNEENINNDNNKFNEENINNVNNQFNDEVNREVGATADTTIDATHEVGTDRENLSQTINNNDQSLNQNEAGELYNENDNHPEDIEPSVVVGPNAQDNIYGETTTVPDGALNAGAENAEVKAEREATDVDRSREERERAAEEVNRNTTSHTDTHRAETNRNGVEDKPFYSNLWFWIVLIIILLALWYFFFRN